MRASLAIVAIVENLISSSVTYISELATTGIRVTVAIKLIPLIRLIPIPL